MPDNDQPYVLGVEAKAFWGPYTAAAPTAIPEKVFRCRSLTLSRSGDSTDVTDRKNGVAEIDGVKIRIRANAPLFTAFTLSGDMICDPSDPEYMAIVAQSVGMQPFVLCFLDDRNNGWIIPVYFSSFDDPQDIGGAVVNTFALEKAAAPWVILRVINGVVSGSVAQTSGQTSGQTTEQTSGE